MTCRKIKIGDFKLCQQYQQSSSSFHLFISRLPCCTVSTYVCLLCLLPLIPSPSYIFFLSVLPPQLVFLCVFTPHHGFSQQPYCLSLLPPHHGSNHRLFNHWSLLFLIFHFFPQSAVYLATNLHYPYSHSHLFIISSYFFLCFRLISSLYAYILLPLSLSPSFIIHTGLCVSFNII